MRITEARGRGGGREPPGTHNVCRTRDTRRSSEARPRADPGPAGSRVSPPPGRRPRADTHTRALYTRSKSRLPSPSVRGLFFFSSVQSARGSPPCSWIRKTTRRNPCNGRDTARAHIAATAALLAGVAPPTVLADAHNGTQRRGSTLKYGTNVSRPHTSGSEGRPRARPTAR